MGAFTFVSVYFGCWCWIATIKVTNADPWLPWHTLSSIWLGCIERWWPKVRFSRYQRIIKIYWKRFIIFVQWIWTVSQFICAHWLFLWKQRLKRILRCFWHFNPIDFEFVEKCTKIKPPPNDYYLQLSLIHLNNNTTKKTHAKNFRRLGTKKNHFPSMNVLRINCCFDVLCLLYL